MIASLLWLVLAGIQSTGGLSAQVQEITVGTLHVKPGEVSSGMLEVPGGKDSQAQVPVTVIRGARPGPALALIAGNHGYEYPPILATQRLLSLIEPRDLSGTVLIVHVANMPSFLGRTIYYSPVDRKNLNRVYPGNKQGTVSERIAYTITTEVISQSDYVVDLHGGDGNESLRPYVYLPVTGNEKMNETMRAMALAFGFDHIVLDRGRPTDPAASIYCSTTAVTRGKPALTAESGYLGTTDPQPTDKLIRGVLSLMCHLKMLGGTADRVEHPIFLDPFQVLTSPATGILYARVERGQTVAKGTVLAVITDFFGKTTAEVRSPLAGTVLYVVSTPPINKGEPVAMVGAPKQP
jgi:hypothetical protein